MDDRFLHEPRREPSPAFARSLRARLDRAEAAPAPRRTWTPWIAAAAAVIAAVLLVTVPAVRVVAQSALDLFRVRNFAAVTVDPDRMQRLRDLADAEAGALDLFERDAQASEPAAPVEYPSIEQAAQAAELPGLRRPSTVPDGMRFEKAAVTAQQEVRLRVRAQKLQHVLDALAIRDVRVPLELEGRTLTVRLPHSVVQTYRGKRHELVTIEAPSPEVVMPPGTEMRTLGTIALRLLGLDEGEARRMADGLDWRGTLLVPVPLHASTFRQVDVNGNRGLLVRSERETDAKGEVVRRGGTMVLWTQGDRVLAVRGDVGDQEALEVALSMR